jgi:uncharacterized protein (DUF2147 family)
MLIPTLLLLAQAAQAPGLDVYGEWVLPPKEEGGPTRGRVTIEEENGAPVGRITEVGEAYSADEAAQEVLGTKIVWGFEADEGDGRWEDGTILDPEAGREYRSNMQRIGEDLQVEGCVLFVCREQTWVRPDDPRAPDEG